MLRRHFVNRNHGRRGIRGLIKKLFWMGLIGFTIFEVVIVIAGGGFITEEDIPHKMALFEQPLKDQIAKEASGEVPVSDTLDLAKLAQDYYHDGSIPVNNPYANVTNPLDSLFGKAYAADKNEVINETNNQTSEGDLINFENDAVDTFKSDNVDSTERLLQIASVYKFNDKEILSYIMEVEKQFKLQPCELLSIVSINSGFKNLKIKEDDNSYSYGFTRLNLNTAKIAYKILTQKYNMSVDEPTEQLLNNNIKYQLLLTGGYLAYAHSVIKDDYQVWTQFEYGYNGAEEYKKSHGDYVTPYADKINCTIKEYNSMIGN